MSRESRQLQAATRELRAAENAGMKIAFQIPVGGAMAIAGQIQLALRHPENTGPASLQARELVAVIRRALGNYPALQKMIDAGWQDGTDGTRRIITL